MLLGEVETPMTPAAPGEPDELSARMMWAALLPVRVRGLGMDGRKAEEFKPSRRSALRLVTSVGDATEKGAPAAVNKGAAENVCAAEKVWGVLRRATAPARRASGTVPEARFAALV